MSLSHGYDLTPNHGKVYIFKKFKDRRLVKMLVYPITVLKFDTEGLNLPRAGEWTSDCKIRVHEKSLFYHGCVIFNQNF